MLTIWKYVLIGLIIIAIAREAQLLSQVRTGRGAANATVSGVAVILVDKGSLAQKAGVQVGDLIVGWTHDGKRGGVDSPVNLAEIEHELGPKGKVSLFGSRTGAAVTYDFVSVPWGLQTTLNAPDLRSLLERSTSLLEANQVTELEQLCWSACPGLSLDSRPWGFLVTAQFIAGTDHWREAGEFLTAALAATPRTNSSQVALIYEKWADQWRRRGDWAGAKQHYEAALTEHQIVNSYSLAVALDLYNLAMADFQLGDISEAERVATQALHIRRKLCPSSLEVAKSLNYMGVFSLKDGDLDSAEDYLQQALSLASRVNPNSREMAFALNNSGAVADRRGDLAKAEQYYSRDLDLSTRLNPNDYLLSYALGNLGTIAFQRGNFARADDYYARALQIQKARGSGKEIAMTLNNQAVVSAAQKDLTHAENLLRQALTIQEKVAPNSIELGQTLDTLGTVIRKQQRPGDAREILQRALTIRQGISPGSLDVSDTIQHLGEVSLDQGDLNAAEKSFSNAAQIRETLAPGSAAYADSLIALAQLTQSEGRLGIAAANFENALTVLDTQEAKLGGATESRLQFNSRYSSYYSQYISVLMKQGKSGLALEVLERSKARTLLSALQAQDIHITTGVPSALLKRQEHTQNLITKTMDDRIHAAATGNVTSQVKLLDLRNAELKSERERILSEMYVASPRYASLHQPKPLSVIQIQHLLDSDTLLLDYSIGPESSFVFAITRQSVESFPLSSGVAIDKLAHAIYKSLSSRPDRRPDSESFGGELSKALLGPLSEKLAKYRRIVIASDQTLSDVPFASLPSPVASELEPYLVSKHEIVSVPSASFLAMVRRSGPYHRPNQLDRVVVVADPVFGINDPRVNRSPESPITNDHLSNSELNLPRLLYSRAEADSIVKAVAPQRSKELLDFAADRTNATSQEVLHSRIVHFATHGFFDSPQLALTGLVFSTVNMNGQPQPGFWSLDDIFNSSVFADLVILSACETAAGNGLEGEGTISLTQAFLFAGTRDVISSLWNVDDASTAELMRLFYGDMEHRGSSPSAALQFAQLRMLQESRWKDPYYWAAFTINGDWTKTFSKTVSLKN